MKFFVLSFFNVPDMMAHVPLYGVRLYARERGMDISLMGHENFL